MTAFSPACARKRTNAPLKTARSCVQARAISSPDVDTSLGPESGHDVEFRGQDDNGRCVPRRTDRVLGSNSTVIVLAALLNNVVSS